MGDIKKKKRHYSAPRKRWDKERIETEKETKKKYGLKNKKELWRTETLLRKKRKDARNLLILDLEQRMKREQELIGSIAKYGILGEKATLDDVLSLPTESFLERRLQTIIWRKGLAGTIIQARQFITHGHIAINGKKVSVPSYLVKKDEEEKIAYYGTPMEVQEKKTKEIKKSDDGDKKALEKKFEEAKPEEGKAEEKKEDAKKAEEKKEEPAKEKKEVKTEEKKKEKEKPKKEEKPKAKKEKEADKK